MTRKCGAELVPSSSAVEEKVAPRADREMITMPLPFSCCCRFGQAGRKEGRRCLPLLVNDAMQQRRSESKTILEGDGNFQ